MRRRWLRIIRWTGIGTAVVGIVAALLLLSGYAFIQSEAGRARLVELLNRHLSTPGAVQVRIGRLEGDLPGRIELHDLSIDDADGTWLRLKFLGASWRPAALLAGTLSISNLDGRGLSVLRLPEDTESTGEFHWPELPLGISVQNFSLREAEIAQPLFGEAVAFRASGDTAIEGSDRVRTTIVVTRTDAISGQAQLRMLLKPRSKYLEFQLALNEADGGVLARALDLDGCAAMRDCVPAIWPSLRAASRSMSQAGRRSSSPAVLALRDSWIRRCASSCPANSRLKCKGCSPKTASGCDAATWPMRLHG
jgi:autotransporter translocation and assembly factor TamB